MSDPRVATSLAGKDLAVAELRLDDGLHLGVFSALPVADEGRVPTDLLRLGGIDGCENPGDRIGIVGLRGRVGVLTGAEDPSP
ncbi:hypothetical protein GS575_11890 [Rhodococcus hoagii]|nr:hypothetical protein [Prescottella equi]